MKKAYEVLAIWRPTDAERKDGKDDKIVFGPKVILSANEQGARLAVARGVDQKIELSQLDVCVRPF